MTEHEPITGAQLGACFGLERAPRAIHVDKTSIAVTCITCDWENNGLTAPLPVHDAFLLTLQLRDTARHDLWTDGRARRTGPLRRGNLSIYDLRTSPMVNSVSAFSNLHFYFPRSTLNAIAVQEGCADVDELPNEPGLGLDDPILAGLGLMLESALHSPAVINTLFFDHVTSAMGSRLVRGYGTRAQRPVRNDVRLSAAHETRVKEMLRADLRGTLTMSELADACHLSIAEFRGAFARATGMMPHQWLMTQRVEFALNLLKTTHLPFAEVARCSDFGDTRQMRRTLAVSLGTSPESVRASYAGPPRRHHLAPSRRRASNAPPSAPIAPVVIGSGDRGKLDGHRVAGAHQQGRVAGVGVPQPAAHGIIRLRGLDAQPGQLEGELPALFRRGRDEGIAGYQGQRHDRAPFECGKRVGLTPP